MVIVSYQFNAVDAVLPAIGVSVLCLVVVSLLTQEGRDQDRGGYHARR